MFRTYFIKCILSTAKLLSLQQKGLHILTDAMETLKHEVAMLDPFMIEKIKQQEEAKRREEDNRLRLELPVYEEPPEEEEESEEDPGRGVIIIDPGCTD